MVGMQMPRRLEGGEFLSLVVAKLFVDVMWFAEGGWV
jgi:hypothetical protein